jgi:hypothetical protein
MKMEHKKTWLERDFLFSFILIIVIIEISIYLKMTEHMRFQLLLRVEMNKKNINHIFKNSAEQNQGHKIMIIDDSHA